MDSTGARTMRFASWVLVAVLRSLPRADLLFAPRPARERIDCLAAEARAYAMRFGLESFFVP
jgi:hypothetical protein